MNMRLLEMPSKTLLSSLVKGMPRSPAVFKGAAWAMVGEDAVSRVRRAAGVVLRPRLGENIVSEQSNEWSREAVDIGDVLEKRNFGQARLEIEAEDAQRLRATFGDAAVDFETSAIFVTSQSLRTPLHSDPQDGLLAHIFGTKRVLLVHPEDSDRSRKVLEKLLELRRVSGDHETISKSAALKDMRCFAFDLNEGDALFLPKRWLHDIHSITPTISFAVRFFIEEKNRRKRRRTK